MTNSALLCPDEIIILADDLADRRLVLTELLITGGYQVIACDTVEACLDYLTRFAGNAVALLSRATLQGRPLLPRLKHEVGGHQMQLPTCIWSPSGLDDTLLSEGPQALLDVFVLPEPLDLSVLTQALSLLLRLSSTQARSEDEDADTTRALMWVSGAHAVREGKALTLDWHALA